ncbi:lytic transglycosylase domain-containing protein [Compostimonas suwonensis]|uniref:Transglycosylase protein with SLT domain n=1 Tax=Compostimonas suwonensis TaxID=1048394 RepID=A0A2M9C363_9MICO|nr:lytic murein transglycosylase [Compostimonas suwonensis]PJJ64991.1 transglycosylase protein with SLT domain [Compostimonas suwonensis]
MNNRRRPRRAHAATAALPALLGALLLAGCTSPVPPPAWAPPAPLPPSAGAPAGPGVSALVDPAWVARTAERTGIPERALAAYAGAAIAKDAERPDCRLGWNTLAGMGYVESRHGSAQGSSIAADGTVSPTIYGEALDGDDVEHIPDSDAGAFDGDAEFDRAVGPFQFIPESWANWQIDASGDGVADVDNIDDAALAAANYLCRASDDLGTEAGWTLGIASYNSSQLYLDRVAEAASGYGSND